MNEEEKRPSTNMRRWRQQNDRKLLLLVLFTLVVVGGGLIALIWGPETLLTSLPCLLAGAGLILIPWLVLTALEKWMKRLDEKDRQAMAAVDQAKENQTKKPADM